MKMILPVQVVELHKNISSHERHPGLQLDKYSKGGKQDEQKDVIEAVTECRQDNNLLSKLLKKRGDWLETLHTKRFMGKAEGPMTLHLSGSGALENAGIAMHPIYGFAWLPGTGIKGMCRAYAETIWLKEREEQGDKDKAQKQIFEAFGFTPEDLKTDGKMKENSKDSASGRLVFHDAWPLKWPKLERDIVNNHHTDYYSEVNSSKKSKDSAKGVPPGDWEDPIPVNFLAIASGTDFDFAISDRKPQDDDLLEIATLWLQRALYNFGAGAKTAAGYGRIVPEGEVSEFIPEKLLRREYNLELASPAFLAGAKQKRDDCELRGATLRGQLRWWWRTMHAGKVQANDLAKLEELVWGSTESGSPISISLIPNSNNTIPYEFNKNQIKDSVGLPKPKSQKKVIQGLFYLSYGMDEVNKKQDNNIDRRFCKSEGSKWKLIVTVKDGNKKLFGKNVEANTLIEQFEASLWLLTNFGGVGSRSRKGFGSFQVVSQETSSSFDDCLSVGQTLRDVCNISAKSRTDSPALESRIGPIKKSIKVDSIWHALNLVGDVYQEFVKGLPNKEDRKALGTPREIKTKHKGKLDYMERHASPVHWSLKREEDNTYTVQMLAFPSTKLPDFKKSKEVLEKLAKTAGEEFDNRKDSGSNQQGKGRSTRIIQAKTNMPINPKAGLPQAGKIVSAILLEERTKKGKWKAKLHDDSMVGSIINSDDVPSDKQPNDEVDLLVTAVDPKNANFKWPTSNN